jgi:cytochrome c peroxidase
MHLPRWVLLAIAVLAAGCDTQEEPRAASLAGTAVSTQARTPFSVIPEPMALDQKRVQLGKQMFRDKRFSADGTIACSDCHDVANGGDDGRRVAIGIGAQSGKINAPTVLNSGLNLAQFWDGRAATLEEQLHGPMESPLEMGSSLAQVRTLLMEDSGVRGRFAAAYPDGLTEANIVDAIVSYERALVTPNSAFDRYLAGDSAALSPAAREGFELFERLGCVSCHQGRNLGGNMFQLFGVMGDYFADRGNVTEADFGRYNVTGREEDRYRFKVPSLRNIAATAPYFHDGSGATLETAVAVMLRYQLGRPVQIEQVDKLVAFLESLSGEIDPTLL